MRTTLSLTCSIGHVASSSSRRGCRCAAGGLDSSWGTGEVAVEPEQRRLVEVMRAIRLEQRTAVALEHADARSVDEASRARAARSGSSSMVITRGHRSARNAVVSPRNVPGLDGRAHAVLAPESRAAAAAFARRAAAEGRSRSPTSRDRPRGPVRELASHWSRVPAAAGRSTFTRHVVGGAPD